MEDIKFLINKRNDIIEELKDLLSMGDVNSEDRCKTRFDSILKVNKQIRLMEDAMIIYRLTNK